MNGVSGREWAFLALIFLYSFIPALVGLVRIPELLGGPALVLPNPRVVIDPLPIALHILGSSIFCLVGAMQFMRSLRRNRPALNRTLGRVVAAAVCVSALDGLRPVFLTDLLVGNDLSEDRRVDLFPDHDCTAMEFDTGAWALYPSRSFLPHKVRVMIDFLRHALA